METITYNRDDWSGGSETVVIKPRSFKVKGSDLHGSYNINTYGDAGQVALVTIKDDGEVIDTLTIYNFGDDWHAEFMDSSRSSNNPVITALRIIHNTY